MASTTDSSIESTSVTKGAGVAFPAAFPQPRSPSMMSQPLSSITQD